MSAPQKPGQTGIGGTGASMQWVVASAWSSFAPVTQVYGVCFDDQGEIVVLSPDGKAGWNLPGGKPEGGEPWRATLLRAVRERVFAELGGSALLGAFAVSEPGRAPYFQLCCAARIAKLDPMGPDPATGKAFVRQLIPPSRFMEVVAIEPYRPMLAAALRWLEKSSAGKPGQGPASPGAPMPGGGRPNLPGSRGTSSGATSAAPRPRRRAGLG